MSRKTSADIRAELADLTDANQAMLDIAKDEDRELSDDEATLFEANMEKVEALKGELNSAEKFEAHKRELASLRVLQSQPAAPIGGVSIRGQDSLSVQHRLGPIKSFHGPNAARDAYDTGMWLRAVVARMNNGRDEAAEARVASRGWQISNTATESTPTGGGYLVPTPLSNAIIDVRALAGVSRKVCRVVPMTSETLTLAKKTAGTTVYYPGEAGATTASDQTWGQIQLTAKKRSILSHVSQELRDDAIIAVMDDLASQMGTDFAVKEDSELIDGDGTSTYGGEVGLLSALGTAGAVTVTNDTWPELTIAEHALVMGTLPDKYWPYGPVWLCSAAYFYNVMARLQWAAGGNTKADIAAGANESFLGYPVYFTNQMPTATAVSTVSALFGVFSQACVIGDRMGVTIKQSEHLKFDYDMLSILGSTRYDINVHDSGDASNAGAYVGLKTAAS